MKPRVVIADSVAADQDIERAILTEVADVVVAQPNDREGLHRLLVDADGVLTCYTKFSEDMVAAMDRCRIIARSGIGVDTIPMQLATSKGIKVTNVPDYCIGEVADHTMALMLALLRGLDPAVRAARAGRWDLASIGRLARTQGRKLGVVGFGNIAQAVARRAKAFEFELLVFDPYVSDTVLDVFGATRLELDDVLAQADVVTLHAPLNASTRHLISERTLALMRSHAILVNTSRGGLIDFDALRDALERGIIGGAGIDVLENEPPQDLAALADVPNLLLTPHAAFYSEESMRELREKSSREIVRVLTGKAPLYQVNG